jgi:tetratricopeptide (TPR) repeat protein
MLRQGALPLLCTAGLVCQVTWAQGTGLKAEWDLYRQAREEYDRGLSAERGGDAAEAAAAFEQAYRRFRVLQQQNPRWTEIYAPLGDLLIRRGQAAAAYMMLNQQVQGGTKDAAVLWQFARALQGIHQTRRALLTAQHAAALDPNNLEIVAFIGERAAELQEDAIAIAALRRCLEQRPDELHRRLLAEVQARSLVRSGRVEEARLALEAAGHSPAVQGLRRELAQALLRRGLQRLPGPETLADALADLRQAHQLAPGPESARALALAELAGGRPGEAVRLLAPLCREQAEAAVLLACGRALTAAGRPREALPWLLRAGEQAQRSPDLQAAARQELCAAHLQLGQATQAVARLGPGPLRTPEEERLLAVASLAAARQALAAPPGPSRDAATFLETAERLRARLTETERAEAALLSIHLQLRSQKSEAALQQLKGLQKEVGQAALDRLLPPGGLDELIAHAALRAGQLPLGLQAAARALPLLPPEAAQRLRNLQAAVYVSRAAAAYERSDYERAQLLLKAVPQPADSLRQALLQYNLAAVALARGRRDEALALWARLDGREVPETWAALGTYYEAGGDVRAALVHYRRYLQEMADRPRSDPATALVERVQRWVEALQRFHGEQDSALEPPVRSHSARRPAPNSGAQWR